MKNNGERFRADQRHDRRQVSRKLCLVLFLSGFFRAYNAQNPDFFDEKINSNFWSTADGQDMSLQNTMTSNEVASTRLTSLDVICGKEYMTVRGEFNGPFNGIVFSKGTYGQSKCVYVKPHSGLTHVTFNVRYDECGTKPDLQGKYFENTIVIQYGTDIIEALDEAKRLRCEWFEAYEKPATFRPAIPVADLDVIEMNFQGDEIDCWMSIQEGKGPWSSEISRIVTVGQPLSIVVAINDNKNQFDMKVKSCFAHDGNKAPIYLIDEDGCVLRPKMISPFKKMRNTNGKASLISYAQFLAFKFPDSVDVLIQCTVEVCRHGCAYTCESADQRGMHAPGELVAEDSAQPAYRPAKTNQLHDEINRILLENSDLLESASSNQASAAVAPPPDESSSYSSPAITEPYAPQPSPQSPQAASTDSIRLEHQRLPFSNDDEHDQHYHNQKIHQNHHYDNNKNRHQQSDLSAQTQVASNNDLGVKPFPLSNSGQSSKPSQAAPLFVPPTHMRAPLFQSSPSPHPKLMTQSQRPGAHNGAHHRHHHSGEPVAQVLNIPLSPMYAPLQSPTFDPLAASFPNLFHKFGSLNMLKSKNQQRLPQFLSNYFGPKKHDPQPFVPNDNFDFGTRLPLRLPPDGFGYRVKRTIRDRQGEVGLKRGFQVVTSLDLQFAPNMSGEQLPQVFEGIPAPIVYGMCFSTSHLFYFLSLAFVLLLSGISSCAYIICRLERQKHDGSNCVRH